MFMYNRAKYQVIWAKNKNILKGGGGDNGSSQAIYGANSPVFVGLAKELFELLRSTFC